MDTARRRRWRRAAAAVAAAACGGCSLPLTAARQDVTIAEIQGPGAVSPLLGRTVTTTGVVTAVKGGKSGGFWLQSGTPDGDERTSEGVFVFASSTPDLAAGAAVEVTGVVGEYRPGGADAGGLSRTELTKASWRTTAASAPLPPPQEITAGAVPAAFTAAGDLERRELTPRQYAVDRYEAWEGMRVRVRDAPVVAPTAHREFWVTVRPAERRTPRGGVHYGGYDQQNSGRLKVAPLAGQPPAVAVGDTLAGETVGPLDYDQHGGYLVAAAQLGTRRPGGLRRETAGGGGPGQVAVATFNVENLDPGDPAEKFAALADGIVAGLRAPSIVALEEVQDDNGATNDAVVGAAQTYRRLAAAITRAGGPAYEVAQVDPADDADGGEPGGNIRVALLYDPRRVTHLARPGGGAQTPVGVDADGGLTHSPGRVAPGEAAWLNSRKPLAAQFQVGGRRLVVVACHFTSKGGDQPLTARVQPPVRASEKQRDAQAAVLRRFVDQLLAADPRARVVIAGDLNDFGFSPALAALTAGGALRPLADRLPAVDRYSYVYQGNSQALDHILVSAALDGADYDVVHLNSEFPDQSSDHDPQVAYLPM